MDILTNPIVISVVVMSALCLMKMNVLLAILISGVIAGLTGGMDLPKTFSTLIAGMGGNSETALSYILHHCFLCLLLPELDSCSYCFHSYLDPAPAARYEQNEAGPPCRCLCTDLRPESSVCFPACWVWSAFHDHHQRSDGCQ